MTRTTSIKLQAPARAKGGKQIMVMSKPYGKPLLKLRKPLPSLPSSNKYTNVPLKTVRQTTTRKQDISSFDRNGAHGIRIKGSMYLGDVQNFVDTTGSGNQQGSRITNEIYLHPNMLIGRPSLLAATYTKFRFRSIKIEYVGSSGASTLGEVYITHTADPDKDPTLLTTSQLKYWVDSIPGTYRGPISTIGIKAGSAFFNLEELDNRRSGTNQVKFYEIDRDTTTLNDVYQGKILMIVNNALPATVGDMELFYDLEMIDDCVSVDQIRSNINSQPSGYFIANFTTTGTDIPVPAQPIAANSLLLAPKSGIYSTQLKQDVPVALNSTNTVNKLFQSGTELITAVVKPPTSTASATFFNCMADLIAGAATRFIAGGPVATITNLALKLLPLLVSSNTNNTQPSYAAWERTKGWKLALINHALLYQADDLPANYWGLTTKMVIRARLKEQEREELEGQESDEDDHFELVNVIKRESLSLGDHINHHYSKHSESPELVRRGYYDTLAPPSLVRKVQ